MKSQENVKGSEEELRRVKMRKEELGVGRRN